MGWYNSFNLRDCKRFYPASKAAAQDSDFWFWSLR